MRFGFVILILPALLWAQEFEFRQEFDTIPVEIDGWQLQEPWAGGRVSLPRSGPLRG